MLHAAVESTISSYNRIAESFSRNWHTYDMTKSCDYFARMMRGNRVIDLGCGTGRDAHYFSQKGYTTTGIDLTPGFLSMAKKNAPDAKIMEMNISNLKFPKKSFDGAWASGSFSHIPREYAEKTLHGIRRVLSKGSPLYLPVEKGVGEEVRDGILHVFYQEGDLEKLLMQCKLSPLPLIHATGVNGNEWILAFGIAQ